MPEAPIQREIPLQTEFDDHPLKAALDDRHWMIKAAIITIAGLIATTGGTLLTRHLLEQGDALTLASGVTTAVFGILTAWMVYNTIQYFD